MQILANTVAGYFGETWGSNALIHAKPQILAKMLQYYPNEALLLNYLRMANNTMSVSNPTMNVYYDGSMERTIIVGTEISTSDAGATISLILHADNYDANDATYLRKDYVVLIPPQYITGADEPYRVPKGFQVTAIGEQAVPSTVYTLKPLGSYGIGTAIPAGTELPVGYTNYSRGSGQPVGVVDYEYAETFTTGIVKTTLTLEGGIAAIKRWRDEFQNGGKNTILRGMEKMNFYHDSQIEKVAWLGQENDNSVTTNNTRTAASRTVLGTKGVLQHMESDSMQLPYAGDAYALTDMEAIKALLESQMVTEREINVFCGSEYMRRYERAGLTFLGANSQGTDLTNKLQQINYPLRKTYMNGVDMYFTEMIPWSSPVSYGAIPEMKELAMIFPNSQAMAKVGNKTSDKILMNNLSIGYLNYGGEDRTRVLKKIDGMTGIEVDGVDQFDEFNVYMLTELMVMLLNKNQMILSYSTGDQGGEQVG
jgi:hypothetical protein